MEFTFRSGAGKHVGVRIHCAPRAGIGLVRNECAPYGAEDRSIAPVERLKRLPPGRQRPSRVEFSDIAVRLQDGWQWLVDWRSSYTRRRSFVGLTLPNIFISPPPALVSP